MKNELQIDLVEIVGSIKSIRLLEEQGCTSEVRQLVTDEGSYLLKSSFKEKYREWVRDEANKLQVLYHHNMPVPTFLGLIDNEDATHLIMSFERGITLTTALRYASSQSERNSLIQSFGEFLHHFHEGEPIKSLIPKGDWLQEQLTQGKRYVVNGQTDATMELLEKLVLKKPEVVKQTMIHGDCTTDNVMVVDGKAKLFIDVGGVSVGDPRYDESLAIRKFIDKPEDMNSFYEGYARYKVSKEEYQYFEEGLYKFF
ncbi:MAG: aminoglycoside phosphotransferase family protein [Bacillota bacterium]